MTRLLFFLATGLAAIAGEAEHTGDIPVFNLNSADVPKVVVFMFKPDRTFMEVTYSKEKQAEFLKLTTENLQKPVRISLNGKVVAERLVTAPAIGHSLKVDLKSRDEAVALALALLESSAPAAQ